MTATTWRGSEVEQRFMWAVQALAASATEQRQLFPPFVEAADELALDHEEAQAAFLTAAEPLLSVSECEALKALDQLLEQMSGPHNVHLWTVESLDTAQEWVEVRNLAGRVLQVMGWPREVPPQSRAVYVGGCSAPAKSDDEKL